MSMANRRSILQIAMAAAFAAPLAAWPAKAATRLISPPAGPMLYRRSIERELNGGATILVTRDFSVSFEHFADGFIIQGQQVAVDVRVPRGLEQFAAMEQDLEETGLFPLSLDPAGLITSPEIALPTLASVESAFGEARRIIALQPIAATEREELQQFVATVHQAGALLLAHLPVDLFAPEEQERSEDQTFSLPSGEQGRVLSQFSAERDPATGLMRSASREVLTQIDDDRRLTRETWELRLI